MARYPAVKPWLEYSRVAGNEYMVENLLAGEEEAAILPGSLVAFMQRLDGKTDPYKVNPSLGKRTIQVYLRFLAERDYLRGKARNRDLGRFAFPMIRYDGKAKHSQTAVILNLSLILFWLPVSAVGIVFCAKVWRSGCNVFASTYMAGLLFGLLVGLALHEAAHTIAAKAYRAPLYEIGFQLAPFPLAYTLIKEAVVKNRRQRAHIYAAGAEANLLLAGLLFTAAYFVSGDEKAGAFFFHAGVENMLLGVFNSCFFFPLDGFKVITTLLGADDMVWSMLASLTTPSIWKKQLAKGPSGLTKMLSVVFMQLAQSVYLICLLWTICNVMIVLL